jgi:hypothetical protein
MDPHTCGESLSIPVRVGHVVAVAEQYMGYSAKFRESIHEGFDVARRIDQKIAFLAEDEIAVSSKGGLGIVTAKVHAVG